jgi:hypothetical protein
MRRIYALLGAESHVYGVQFEAEHNYNRNSREAVYAWMARWLQHAPADVKRPEKSFTPDPLPDLLVFHQRPLPANAVTAAQLTGNWIASAQRQLETTDPSILATALRHALGFADSAADVLPESSGPRRAKTVLLAGTAAALEPQLRAAGLAVRRIESAPFDASGAAKIRHFETYNRTPASQRVADIVAAARRDPGAVLVAEGDDALAGLLAAAFAPLSMAILDVGDFDTSNDQSYLDRLYIPGLRRAGGLQTAARMASRRVVVHHAGESFKLSGVRIERRQLPAGEIIRMVSGRAR